MRRFRGTLLAALALVVVLGVWWALAPAPMVVDEAPTALFRFDKDQLTGFRLTRPDLVLHVHQVDGVWAVEGQPWRPGRSMIRRVAHQLHDLDARAEVVEATAPLSTWGLGDGAVRVDLELSDGRTLAFEVGDPNPTSVSYYLRPLPGEAVYVVKKSAVDYWRLDAASFREDRIAAFDTPDAVRIDAVVDGRELALERTGERTWAMRTPVAQRASREAARAMLGRVAGLRAERFVADQPGSLEPWGLAPPSARLSVGLSDGRSIAVEVGDVVPDTDPPLRWIRLVSEDAVYAVRDGFLEPFSVPVEALRDRRLVGRHEWQVEELAVVRGDERVTLGRTADGWRWPDGEAVAGSTPVRVASRAAELGALSFREADPSGDAWAELTLRFDDGTSATIRLGPEADRWATVAGGAASVDEVAIVDDGLPEVVSDLMREWSRKRARDADKGLDLDDPGAEH